MTSPNQFSNISFDDFRQLAKDENLSKYERIGFPDSYRKGFEGLIFSDICQKIPNIFDENKLVIDIGPGCSDLPLMLKDLCRERNHKLVLIDNKEMLDLLPDEAFIEKIPALYPNCPEVINKYNGSVDVIICYSVLQYVLIDTAFFRFLDTSLSLLSPGGQMLIGDIPNVSKRKRFFASETGARFHQDFMNTKELPIVEFNKIENDQIDDAVVMSIIQRARLQGFDAYIVPQGRGLPMANRREDVLIIRP